jgi:predicted amidohydrolase YtcJ
MGQEARKGHLQIGYDADLTLFRLTETGPLEICATICGGETIYLAEGIEGTS